VVTSVDPDGPPGHARAPDVVETLIVACVPVGVPVTVMVSAGVDVDATRDADVVHNFFCGQSPAAGWTDAAARVPDNVPVSPPGIKE